jgi:hypothetical protein
MRRRLINRADMEGKDSHRHHSRVDMEDQEDSWVSRREWI